MPSNPYRIAVDATSNRHLKLGADGARHFPLVMTVWELFYRATLAEVDAILAAARSAGCNAVMATFLDEVVGPDAIGSAGGKPFTTHAWTDASAQNGGTFWTHVRQVVEKVRDAGMWAWLLPCWSAKYVADNSAFSYFCPGGNLGQPATAAAAEARALSYGRFLGSLLADLPVVWVLGGDIAAETWAGMYRVFDELSEGLREGVATAGYVAAEALSTYHPGWSAFRTDGFHARADDDGTPWCQVHAGQAAHVTFDDEDVYLVADAQHALTAPVRPFMQMEYAYLNHARGHNGNDPPAGQHDGTFRAYDVRLGFFWSVFRGGAAFAFSTAALWQLYKAGRTPINGPILSEWPAEVAEPGVQDLKFCRWLIDRLPPALFFSRTQLPNATLLPSQSSVNQHRKVATGNWDGAKCSWAYVYFPSSGWDPASNSWAGSHSVAVDLTKFDAAKGGVRAWWYNARDGSAVEATGGTPAPTSGNAYARQATTFTKPHDAGAFVNSYDRGNDAVLFLVSEGESEGGAAFNGSPAYVPPDAAAPTLASAALAADGVTVTLTFDEPVTEPPVGGDSLTNFKFTIDGDGDFRATLAGHDGATVVLTLFGVTVRQGMEVLVRYDDVTGAITDTAGNALGPFPDFAVTNGSAVPPADATAPQVTDAVVAADGQTLTVSFGEPVTATPTSAWAVVAGGQAVAAADGLVAPAQATLALSLGRTVLQGEAVTLSYDAGVGDVQDEAGNPLPGFQGLVVTNGSTQQGEGPPEPPPPATPVALASFVHCGHWVDYTPQAAVPAGAVVLQGALVGVAPRCIPAGAAGGLAVQGVFDFPKASGAGTAIAAGAMAYWDAAAGRATADAAGHALIGKAVRAAADADATVRVRMSQ